MEKKDFIKLRKDVDEWIKDAEKMYFTKGFGRVDCSDSLLVAWKIIQEFNKTI